MWEFLSENRIEKIFANTVIFITCPLINRAFMMTKQDCQKLINAYVDWLKTGLSVESLEDACELTTPFLDRHNDHLQIYVSKQNGKINLSDDGYILSDLRSSGFDIGTTKRKAILETVLNGFGVKMDGKQLVVEASIRNPGKRLHALVQAMLAVNDMFVLAQPRTATLFWEDVQEFLDDNEIRYNPRIKITGQSGFDHAIDFLIPKSNKRPERLIQAINSPAKNSIEVYLFSLEDSRKTRGEGSEAYALLNDRDHTVGGDIIEALENYDVIHALWSEKEKHIESLAA